MKPARKYQRKGTHLNFYADDELIEQVDEFRWRGRMPSRKEAIEWLLRFALRQKPQLKEGK